MGCRLTIELSRGSQGAKERRVASAGAICWTASSYSLTANDARKFVPMALLLLLRAMAHECYGALTCKSLNQAKCEFLSVVLDRLVLVIYGTIHEQFTSVRRYEFSPGAFTFLYFAEKDFTRSEGRHPNVVTSLAHPAAMKPCRKNS